MDFQWTNEWFLDISEKWSKFERLKSHQKSEHSLLIKQEMEGLMMENFQIGNKLEPNRNANREA